MEPAAPPCSTATTRISRASPPRRTARGITRIFGFGSARRRRDQARRLPPLRDRQRGDRVGHGRDRRLLHRHSRPALGDEQPRRARRGQGGRRRCRRGRRGAVHRWHRSTVAAARHRIDVAGGSRRAHRRELQCEPGVDARGLRRARQRRSRSAAAGASPCSATCSSSATTRRASTPSWPSRSSTAGIDSRLHRRHDMRALHDALPKQHARRPCRDLRRDGGDVAGGAARRRCRHGQGLARQPHGRHREALARRRSRRSTPSRARAACCIISSFRSPTGSSRSTCSATSPSARAARW